jgi:hypothetical protein
VIFVVKISNKLQKIGFGRKNQFSPQCVHNWANGHATLVMHYIMDEKDMKNNLEVREGHRGCSLHNNTGTHKMI